MTTRDPFGQDSYNPSIANGRPPVPPGLTGGTEPAPHFAGIVQPRSDFQATRDGRRSLPLYYDIDLSVARSIAAQTHITINTAGNSFYADQAIDLAGNTDGGIALVHFQDTDISPGGTPITVQPGAIFKIPFTQLLIENFAQPGKKLRIIYGIDVDFQPGSTANVNVATVPTPLSTTENEGGGPVLQVARFSDAIVRAGAAFIGGGEQAAAGAGTFSSAQLYNPVASGVILYVDRLKWKPGAANSASIAVSGATTLATLVGQGINKNLGGAASLAQIRVGAPAVGFGTVFWFGGQQSVVEDELVFDPPLRIPAGNGIHISERVSNDLIDGNFEWRELTI